MSALSAVLGLLGAAPVEIVSADQLGPAPGPLLAFVLLSVLVVGGAIVTITRKNLIAAVMALVATFFGIAGLYAMLSAHFLAAIQVLVYAGGIMVLFVFVIMVLNREESDPWAMRNLFSKSVGIGAILYLGLRLSQLLITWANPACDPDRELACIVVKKGLPPIGFGTVAGVGETFFTDYLFPFEAISLLLIIAIIGAVVLARSPAAQVTSQYDLPEGETDMRQPQHAAGDELVGLVHHGAALHHETDDGKGH